MEKWTEKDSDISKNIGWSVRVMTAHDISAGMLRPKPYNLNAQAHDTTAQLIRDVISSGVNVREIYVDTVGTAQDYQNKLAALFPSATVTVTKKADSLFPIVSAASVCAKVTRDMALELYENGSAWGSGYPGDARTVSWLKSNIDPVFGWKLNPGIVRYSWQTTVQLLDNGASSVRVDW